jgi:hypothetical protein
MQIFVGRLRMASTHLVFKVSGVYISNLGKKFEIFTSSNLFQRRIPAAFVKFHKS